MISTFYLCDGIMDCQKNEDENNCHILGKLLVPVELCTKIGINGILLKNDGRICNSIERDKSSKTLSCENPLAKMDELTLDFASDMKTNRNANQNLVPESMHCIYEPDECGHLKYFTNGKHLLACENHICPQMFFKCPKSYCVPRYLACNGDWNCPGGTDEIACQRNACPGLVKCRDSVICISSESVCNSFSDCPLSDDENFCISKIPVCPSQCQCKI